MKYPLKSDPTRICKINDCEKKCIRNGKSSLCRRHTNLAYARAKKRRKKS